ncbi:MAG: response regulator transcription factor [Kiritimatiellae bacterium]|nr:response regulator transcription factor [Kiritimatiellia bacterium]MDD5520635.1 response regulator transcription factor [Kiritimatiellia bacterium]
MTTSKQSSKQKKRVFIVDDHPIVRYGITRILNNEHDFTVCGDAESAEKALAAIGNLHPDIIIVDISLKDMDGLQLTRTIRARYPNLPIVILSMHDERIYAHKALRAGANGYIMKEESSEKLVLAIRQILKGDIFVSAQVQKNVLHAYASKEGARETPVINKLSDREREIFLLVGAGHTSKSIANKLNLSVKTIETHRSRIKQKFGLDGSARMTLAAVEWAKRENLVSILT